MGNAGNPDPRANIEAQGSQDGVQRVTPEYAENNGMKDAWGNNPTSFDSAYRSGLEEGRRVSQRESQAQDSGDHRMWDDHGQRTVDADRNFWGTNQPGGNHGGGGGGGNHGGGNHSGGNYDGGNHGGGWKLRRR